MHPVSVLALFHDAPAAERRVFEQAAQPVALPAGAQIFWPGDRCGQIVFVASGTVRVYQLGEEGRELTLYQIASGESCLLTASCILGEVPFPAQAVVEADARGWAVPAATFRQWVETSPWWRRYVFALFGKRMAAVLAKLEAVSFRRIDVRLAGALLTRIAATPASGVVRTTHQQLADELGTAREVVSRTLASWAAAGWVELHRGRVVVIDRARIAALCD